MDNFDGNARGNRSCNNTVTHLTAEQPAQLRSRWAQIVRRVLLKFLLLGVAARWSAQFLTVTNLSQPVIRVSATWPHLALIGFREADD
jgi:hypothetical protein